VGPVALSTGLECAASDPSGRRTRPGRDRPLSQGRLAADQANAQRRKACLVFFDETALSLTPNVRRTWAPVGQPAVLTHRFNWKKASMAAAICYGVRGGGAQLAFHSTAGNYDTDRLIGVLAELRRFLGGEKATLLWDGLPAHRSRAMQAWLNTQRHWLVVERLLAYAPELNPTEGLWAWLKGTELANLVCPTLGEVVEHAERGVQRVRSTPQLAYSFLRRTGLSVS
jgi:DDE superfamily endonuclease